MSNIKKDDKIFIAGHNGMVGSAIERKFIQEGFKNILTFSSKDLDLRDQSSVDEFYKKIKPLVNNISNIRNDQFDNLIRYD